MRRGAGGGDARVGLTPLAVAPPPPTPTDEVLLLPVLLLLLLLLAVESRRSACSFTHVSPKALAKWSSTESVDGAGVGGVAANSCW